VGGLDGYLVGAAHLRCGEEAWRWAAVVVGAELAARGASSFWEQRGTMRQARDIKGGGRPWGGWMPAAALPCLPQDRHDAARPGGAAGEGESGRSVGGAAGHGGREVGGGGEGVGFGFGVVV
jgi:hypothetical protein